MRIGTKSLIFGAHQVFIHPWFVAWAWKRLYGFPLDPRLWVAFVVHDLGYARSPNMDGPEGERHVEWGARVMGRLFGSPWQDFALYHSRFYAKKDGQPFSRLCVADKLALALTPAWLYLPLAIRTGEVAEYMQRADERRDAGEKTLRTNRMAGATPAEWYERVQEHCRLWALEHADGRPDTWTPVMGQRVPMDRTGVWE